MVVSYPRDTHGVKRTERSDGPADRAASTKYVSVDAEPAVPQQVRSRR